MKHPFTGEELIRAPRVCPIRGIDIAFGDGVVWKGKPWIVNSMHRLEADGATRLIDLVRYGSDPAQPSVASAPVHELMVFEDSKPWTSPEPAYRDSYE